MDTTQRTSTASEPQSNILYVCKSNPIPSGLPVWLGLHKSSVLCLNQSVLSAVSAAADMTAHTHNWIDSFD